MKVKCEKVKNKDKEFNLTYTLSDEALKNKLEQTIHRMNSLKKSIEIQSKQVELLELEKVEIEKILEG